MHKRLKRIALFLGIATLGVTFSIGVAVSTLRVNTPVQTNAALYETELKDAIKINVDIGEWGWTDLKLYYFNAKSDNLDPATAHNPDSNGWPGTLLTGNSIVLPATIHHADVIVVGSEGGIDNKQTADITLIDGPGEYLIDSFEWDGSTNKADVALTRSGDFSVDIYKTIAGYTGGIDSLRTRIWLDRGHFGDNGITALNIDNILYQPSGYSQVRVDSSPYTSWFPYYDILLSTINGKSFHFLKLSGDLTSIFETSTSLTYSSGDSSFLFYLPSTDQTGDETLAKGQVLGRITNSFFGKVLDGYLSCSESSDNGFNAFQKIDTNFLPRIEGVWDMEGELSAIMIDDYANEENYSTGTRGNSIDAFTKYQMMQNLYTAASNPTQNIGYFDNKSSLPLIIGIALVGLTSLAGLYILRKKRA